MHDLSQIELPDLLDLLAQQTNRYMKMLSEGATKDEFQECRKIIISIQAEIHIRKNQRSYKETASPDHKAEASVNKQEN